MEQKHKCDLCEYEKRQEHNMYAHKKDRHVPPNNIKCNLCGYETTFTVNMEEHNDGTENSNTKSSFKSEPLENEIEKQETKAVSLLLYCMYTKSPKGLLPFYLLWSEVLVHPNTLAEHMEELDLTSNDQHTKHTISGKAQARVTLIITLPLLPSPVS